MSRRVAAVLFAVSLGAACGSPPSTSETGSASADAVAPPSGPAAPVVDEADGSTTPPPAGGDPTGPAVQLPPPTAPPTSGCTPTGPRETGTVVTSQLPARDELSPLVKHPVLVLRGLELCAGQPHLFTGGHTATVSVNMLWGIDARCTFVDDPGDPATQSRRRSVFSTRNHGGSGQQRQDVRWVFTPDRNGTYDCELRAWGRTPRGVSGTMTVVPGTGTRFRMSGVAPGATEWRQEPDVVLCWDDPDDPGCRRSETVLRREVTVEAGVRSLDVYAGVEASICTSGYVGCTPGTAGIGDFTIRTRLIATQVVRPGSSTMCPGAQPHDRTLTTAVPGAGRLNHFKIDVEIDHPVPVVVRPDCSPTFVVRVLVDYVKTNPERPNHGGLVEGRIDDVDPADPESLNRYYTSAYVLTNR
jgi:hypothetical protein